MTPVALITWRRPPVDACTAVAAARSASSEQGGRGLGTGEDGGTGFFKDLADSRCDQGSRKCVAHIVQGRVGEYAIYRGEGAQAWSDTIGSGRFRMQFWHAAILPRLPELSVPCRDEKSGPAQKQGHLYPIRFLLASYSFRAEP